MGAQKEQYTELFNQLINDLRQKKSLNSDKLLLQAFERLKTNRDTIQTNAKAEVVTNLLQASIIAVNDIGLGKTSVISLLLYHTYTRESFDFEQLEKNYNKDIAIITEGLINVSSIEEKAVSSQAENFRRLLLNLAKDVRVILIILAERLQQMREMKELNHDEQLRQASEATYLFAPLAHRLGLYLVKSEMEDLSLKYLNREIYTEIAKKLDETQKSRNTFIAKFVKPIEKVLVEQRFKFEIKGRPKSIHSIWNKMKKKEVGFEDIYDLFAIRIIIACDYESEKADCWQVYSAVTDIYQPNPLRLRDWISVPKTNGYESLHTTVVGQDGKWVEVQIRTERMNEIAEKGVAAHWKYKGGQDSKGVDGWLGKIREILETPEPDAGNFIDDFKLSLYAKEIFVFTPKGDLRKFPANASVLDFAYDVHTQVGANCTGAKVNGKIVPIRHKLQNGDKVGVLTSKGQKPKLDWINFVVTSRAQKKIRQALNDEKVKEAQTGKELVQRRFKNWKIDYDDDIIRVVLKTYKLPNAQDFYAQVAQGKIDLANIKEIALEVRNPENEGEEKSAMENLESSVSSSKKEKSTDYLVIDEKVDNVDYRLAKCCNPIMGDNIFGFVTINEGIKIHRTVCPNAVQLIGKYGYRIVNAKWTRTGPDSSFPVDIIVTGEDQSGILNSISEVITKDTGVTLHSISLDADEGAFKGKVGISVRDLSHLDFLLKRLGSLKGIYSVRRTDAGA